MCKEGFVTSGPSDMLTLAAIIPVFHQVEEIMEMKQKVLVEMIKSSGSVGANQSITEGSCRCWEQPCAPWRGKGPGRAAAAAWAQPS